MKQKLLFLSFYFSLIVAYGQSLNLEHQITQMYDFNTDSFVDFQKEAYSYNSFGQPIEIIKYIFEDDSWQNDELNELVYNPDGQLMERIILNWDNDGNVWKHRFKYTYSYLGSQLFQEETYIWDNSWTLDSFKITFYNEHNLKRADELFQITGQEYRNTWLTEYAYNDHQKLTEITVYEQYPERNPKDKTIYERDPQTQKITKIITQEYKNDQWLDFNIIELKSDIHENLDSIFVYDVTQDPVNTSGKITNIYDYDKSIEDYNTPFEFTDNFIPFEFDYKLYNNKITDHVISMNVGFWMDYMKIHYYYSDDVVLGVEENSLSDLSVYPNPAKNILNIKSKKDLQGTINVYDVNGRAVIQKQAQGLITTLNLEPLASGIYLLKLTTPSGTLTKRITKQ